MLHRDANRPPPHSARPVRPAAPCTEPALRRPTHSLLAPRRALSCRALLYTTTPRRADLPRRCDLPRPGAEPCGAALRRNPPPEPCPAARRTPPRRLVTALRPLHPTAPCRAPPPLATARPAPPRRAPACPVAPCPAPPPAAPGLPRRGAPCWAAAGPFFN